MKRWRLLEQDMIKCSSIKVLKSQPLIHAVVLFLIMHVMALVLTYCSALWSLPNFSSKTLQVKSLALFWNRWDTGQFTAIATNGYQGAWQTAFFPLYPLLEYAISRIFHISVFAAGLLISNVCYLGIGLVFYKIAEEQADVQAGNDYARSALLCLFCYPAAFFLMAAYNESLFLLLVLCFFYFRKKWGALPSFFGFLAALTRSSGLVLSAVALYWIWEEQRLQVEAIAQVLAPVLGVALFSAYCFIRFGDALAFSHAQAIWGRQLAWPWQGFVTAWILTVQGGLLRFDAIHTIMEMSAVISVGTGYVLLLVQQHGRARSDYTVYSTALFLFLLLFPSIAPGSRYPLQSFTRLSLEIFPLYFVFARWKGYLLLALPIYTLMLLQFLTGGWMV